MAKRLSSVLGVDIGSRAIKVAEVRAQGGSACVSAIGMIDTPEGAVDHTGVYNAEAVGMALKQLLAQSGASSPFAVVSIAGQASVLVRTLEVPRMSEAELKEHMQWEINRNIPFAESNVLSDFKPLEDEDPNSPNMDVVMAISPQSAIDTIVACIKKAGKQTAAIDVQALSLARSLQTSYDDVYHGQTVCVVDVGHKTTSINIYKGGRLLMPRQVPVGGEMFTKAIADAQGVGPDEAELLKQQKCHVHPGLLQAAVPDAFGFTPSAPGMTQEFQPYNPFAEEPVAPPAPESGAVPEPAAELAHPVDFSQPAPFEYGAHPAEEAGPAPAPVVASEPAPPVDAGHPDYGYTPPVSGAAPISIEDPETQRNNNAVAPVLEEFVAEIRRSLDYFSSRGGKVDHVVLCGGAAKLQGLSETLTQALGISCDTYDPLRHLNLSGKKIEPDFVDEHRPDFAVAVGNGLHIFFD